MPMLRTEIDETPTTRRDRILTVIAWVIVTAAAIGVGVLVVGAFR